MENKWEKACKEFLKGCTCAGENKQEECPECLKAFLDYLRTSQEKYSKPASPAPPKRYIKEDVQISKLKKNIKNEINNMEYKILIIISAHSIFSIKEIKDCYLYLKSFDKTIATINHSQIYNVSLYDATRNY